MMQHAARLVIGGATVALALGALAVQPAAALGGGGHGGGGHGGGLGGLGGHSSSFRLHTGRGDTFNGGGFNNGLNGGGFNRGVRGYGGFAGDNGFGNAYARRFRGSGFGQNGDGLSDYAPYGRPVDGCDPSTPARVRYYCY